MPLSHPDDSGKEQGLPGGAANGLRGGDPMRPIFRNRGEAGQLLARELMKRNLLGESLLILGVPRGGVVVAAEVARALGAPLDVVIARRLRAPAKPELAIGAVVSG